MDCQYFTRQIDAYFAGSLDLIESFRFENHVKDCPACSEPILKRFLELSSGKDGLTGVFNNDFSMKGCLHPRTIEEFVEGTMLPEEIRLINQHLECCLECFSMVEEYWQYLQAGTILHLYPRPLIETSQIPSSMAMEYQEEEDIKQFAAYSPAEEESCEGIYAFQNESGTIQARLFWNEEDVLQVILIEYAQVLYGQTARIFIPHLHRFSEERILTGKFIEFSLGSVEPIWSGFQEIQIKILL